MELLVLALMILAVVGMITVVVRMPKVPSERETNGTPAATPTGVAPPRSSVR